MYIYTYIHVHIYTYTYTCIYFFLLSTTPKSSCTPRGFPPTSRLSLGRTCAKPSLVLPWEDEHEISWKKHDICLQYAWKREITLSIHQTLPSHNWPFHAIPSLQIPNFFKWLIKSQAPPSSPEFPKKKAHQPPFPRWHFTTGFHRAAEVTMVSSLVAEAGHSSEAGSTLVPRPMRRLVSMAMFRWSPQEVKICVCRDR